MSDTREQSYYEIALTNRQVMSIFIVLLVCLLAAFVSGVWIGRQGAGVRVQTAATQSIEQGAGEDGAPLDEMDFFSQPAAEAEPSDVAAEPAAPPPDSSPSGATERPDPEPPAQERARAAAEPESPEPEPEPEPSPPARAAAGESEPASPPAGGPASAGTAAEFLYIQVFSSNDREQAQSIVDRLRESGYAAFLSSVEVDGRLMHRVRIGPYAERAEAEEVAETVQRQQRLSTWITP